MDPLLLHDLEMDGRGDRGNAVKIADGEYNLNLDIDLGMTASTSSTSSTSNTTNAVHANSHLGTEGFIWDGEDPTEYGHGTGRGWLRISDDSVRECGIENVLAEGSSAFMLYYERVVVDVPGVYPSRRAPDGSTSDGRDSVGVPNGVEMGDGSGSVDGVEVGKAGRDSEETLRPRTKTVVVNGSANSLVTVGVGVMSKHERPPISISTESGRPRIIRSVDAGRKKSVPPSAAPSPTETTSDGTFVSPSVSTSTLASREQSVVSSSASEELFKGPRSSSPDRYYGQLPNGTHAYISPNPNSSTLSFPTPPPSEPSPPQSSSSSSSPSSSPSRPKPNTLKRKSKLSHSAGKKPPSIQLQHS